MQMHNYNKTFKYDETKNPTTQQVPRVNVYIIDEIKYIFSARQPSKTNVDKEFSKCNYRGKKKKK